jgi:hypothetical protein
MEFSRGRSRLIVFGEEMRKLNAETQRAQRKRKAKRDGNTEFTEIGTQRAQRRENQEKRRRVGAFDRKHPQVQLVGGVREVSRRRPWSFLGVR